MQILLADSIPPTPWRNGGGQTRELFAEPAGADWRLRVSLADIEQDGPFSSFPGVQRHFAVLQGPGVELTLNGQALQLTPASAALAFDGAAAPGCRLLGGATRDLNLMLRERSGELQRARSDVEWDAPWPWRACFTVAPARLLDAAGTAHALPAWSLALDLPAGPLRLQLTQEQPAYWLGA
ncbi:MAG: HutD family protein [Inhella sp.]